MNKYDKALWLFKDQDRACLKEPRPYEEYIVSSDSHVLIRIRKSLCEEEYTKHEKQPDFGRIMPPENCNISFSVQKLGNVLKKYYKENEKTEEGQIECEECCGSGYVRWRYNDSFGLTHYERFDCPICEGEGYVEKYETTENYQNISINNVCFTIKNLKKINDALEILGVEEIKITHLEKYKTMRILVEEGVDIIAMPNTASEPIEKITLKI